MAPVPLPARLISAPRCHNSVHNQGGHHVREVLLDVLDKSSRRVDIRRLWGQQYDRRRVCSTST